MSPRTQPLLGGPAADPEARLAQPSNLDLDRLAEQAQRGDRRALEALCRASLPNAARIFARLGADRQEGEDLVQMAMVQLCRSIARFAGDSTYRVWLFGLCARVYLQHRRGRGRLRRMLDWLRHSEGAEEATRSDEMLVARESLARLERCFATLRPERRVVFMLRELEGLSGEEIALSLGIPIGTVWTHLHQVRRALIAASRADETDDG